MGQAENKRISEFDWVLENFAAFEKNLNGSAALPVHTLRKKSFESFSAKGFPQPQEESWKYTNLAGYLKSGFVLASKAQACNAEQLKRYEPYSQETPRIVFVDGYLSTELSHYSNLEAGVKIFPISNLLKAGQSLDPDAARQLHERLGKDAGSSDNSFLAFNGAFVSDGAFVLVEKNQQLKIPIQVFFISSSKSKTISHPRLMVVAQENTQVALVEHYMSSDDSEHFVSGVSDIQVGKNAVLDHYKVQQLNQNSFHVGILQTEIGQAAQVCSHLISLGSRLTRNEVNYKIYGERSHSILNGLSILKSEQQVDNTTVIEHAKPHAESMESFKGVYADKSKGVFSGTIIVQPDAQKTNAFQSNKSLLLSDQATIDSKPQLKIWADDVKCTHGATVGQLDEQALFYLRSRGVGLSDARAMLIRAFASDILAGVKVTFLRNFLEQAVQEKLEQMVG